MNINLQYMRTAPDGRTIKVTPKTQAQLEYFRDLENHGYKYVLAPVIHRSENSCVACEG